MNITDEIRAHLHLIRCFADETHERNWADKRLYIKQQAERIMSALDAPQVKETPPPSTHSPGNTFTHRLIENTFSWAMEGCHYLDPKSMERLIEATKAGMKPEDAATWRSDLPEIMAKRARLLREHWASFCDADPFPDSDVFADRMEAAGLIELVPVTDEALEDHFAAERGIEPDGMMYRLTDAGRAALATTEGKP
jgi:hypothetical protein